MVRKQAVAFISIQKAAAPATRPRGCLYCRRNFSRAWYRAPRVDDDEVLKRCLYPLINEGARILEDGIAIRPCDIDIVYINGYGFPEVTGGPMFWADQQGLDNILADIKRFGEEYGGPNWEPAPLLERLVAEAKPLQVCGASRLVGSGSNRCLG